MVQARGEVGVGHEGGVVCGDGDGDCTVVVVPMMIGYTPHARERKEAI